MRVLDTDTCVELLRGNRSVIEQRMTLDDEIATTWITAAELFYGAAKSKAPRRNGERVQTFLSSLENLGLDAISALIFGEVKAGSIDRGQAIPDADLWIAAISLSHGASVVTGNQRHFERIPGLVLENWIR